jgi:putative sterol carrier protein
MEWSLAKAERELVQRAAQFVRSVPDVPLEQLMRSPLRRPIIDGIFWRMPQQLDRTRATGVASTIRWRITGQDGAAADVYHLVIAERRARVIRGRGAPDPHVTITIDATEFVRLVTGSSNPMQAYFAGKLAVSGDIMLAAKLTALFHMPAPAP